MYMYSSCACYYVKHCMRCVYNLRVKNIIIQFIFIVAVKCLVIAHQHLVDPPILLFYATSTLYPSVVILQVALV